MAVGFVWLLGVIVVLLAVATITPGAIHIPDGDSIAPFDDAEAQLRIRQAASTVTSARSEMEELSKALDLERRRVVRSNEERELNQALMSRLQQGLTAAEKKLKDGEAALKAAQEERARGLASTSTIPPSPRPAEESTPVDAPKVAPDQVEANLQLSLEDRQRVQKTLTSQGFDPGPVDGMFGPRTRDAIRAWQKARGLESTGFLSEQNFDALFNEESSRIGASLRLPLFAGELSFLRGCWESGPFRHSSRDEPGVSTYCFDEHGMGQLDFRRPSDPQNVCRPSARAEWADRYLRITDSGTKCSDGSTWSADTLECGRRSDGVAICDGSGGADESWQVQFRRVASPSQHEASSIGNLLRLPAAGGDLSFLKGCWRSAPFQHGPDFAPGISTYCFDAHGRGQLEYRRPTEPNYVCRPSARAEWIGNRLRIVDEDVICVDGREWYADTIFCQRSSDGTAQCGGSASSGRAWTVELRRLR